MTRLCFVGVFCLCMSSEILAGPAEDLSARRAKLESLEPALSAWSYDSWRASFTDQINFYNGINSGDTTANLRCNYVYDLTVTIEANKTLTVPATTLAEAQRTRSLYPDNLILTLMDAASYDGGFSGATGTFSNWTVAQYEAAADAVADVVIADQFSDGIQVDIEPISRSWMPFMRRLSTRLHNAGKLCTLYILPGWTASGDQPLTDANYTELFTICDSVALDLYTQMSNMNVTNWQNWATNQLNRIVPLADSVNGNLVIGISTNNLVPEALAIASNYRNNVSFAGLAVYDLTFHPMANANATLIHSWASGLAAEANPDSYGTLTNTVLNMPAPGVLANDFVSGGETITLVNGTTNGQLNLNSTTGAFTYTPNNNFTGEDTFTYKLVDGNDESEVVTVTIEVGDLGGLVAYFSFDGHARDVSGNGVYTEAYGNPGYTSNGISGQAISYSDVDDYITTGSNTFTPPWSASYWVKRSSRSGWSMLTGNNPGGNYIFLQHWNGTNSVGVGLQGVNDYTHNYVAPVNNWVNLVFVGKPGGTDLYVNGVFQSTTPAINFPFISIGMLGNSPVADLDEIAIWNRNLSLAEIQGIHSKGLLGEPFAQLPNLPSQAAASLPANAAVNQRVDVSMTWQAATNADGYRVYIGTSADDLVLHGSVSGTTFQSDSLVFGQNYYWRIDSVNSGGVTAGELRSFTTASGMDDSDGDGTNDQDEQTIGTNPYDENSKWQATAELENSSSFTLSWPSIAPKQYRVMYQSTLTGTWQVYTTVNATPPLNSLAIPITQEKCFFRVEVVE